MTPDEQAVEILLKDLQKIEDELLRRIKIALESGRLSSKDLAELSGQLDFFTELQKLGYTSKLEAHFGKYEEIIKQIQKQAAEQGVAGLVGTNVRDLDNIVNLQAKELLGKARAYADTLKTNLLSHIVAGTPIKGIIESMKETKLADYQLRVSLTTGLRQFRILSTSELYKDEPEKRFILYGPIDEKNRPACAGVLTYQNDGRKKTYYHGSNYGGEELRPNESESGNALFLTDDAYSGEGYGRYIHEVITNLKKTFLYDASGERWFNVPQKKIIDQARDRGYDSVKFENIRDEKYGNAKSNVLAVFNKEQISVFNVIDTEKNPDWDLEESPIGFTRKEIDDGAWTKLAVKGIKEFGLNKDGELPPHLQKLTETIEYNFLTRGGFNCRHEPLAISE